MADKVQQSRRDFLKGTSAAGAAAATMVSVPLFSHIGTKIIEEPERFRDLPATFLLTEVRVVWDPKWAAPLKNHPFKHPENRWMEIKSGSRLVIPAVTRFNSEPVWSWRPMWGQWVDLSGEKRIRVVTNILPVEALAIGIGKDGKPVIIEMEMVEGRKKKNG